MNKTLALANILDSQLTILNIEGWRSEHQIWTDYETHTEFEETPCPECNGSGEVCVDDEYEPGWCDLFTCPECDGSGQVEVGKEVTIPYEDSWTESNIVI